MLSQGLLLGLEMSGPARLPSLAIWKGLEIPSLGRLPVLDGRIQDALLLCHFSGPGISSQFALLTSLRVILGYLLCLLVMLNRKELVIMDLFYFFLTGSHNTILL